MEIPDIPANQSEPEDVQETEETPIIPVNQSEPEEVPEPVETLSLQLMRANQRRS